jgi:hypothetical protein
MALRVQRRASSGSGLVCGRGIFVAHECVLSVYACQGSFVSNPVKIRIRAETKTTPSCIDSMRAICFLRRPSMSSQHTKGGSQITQAERRNWSFA